LKRAKKNTSRLPPQQPCAGTDTIRERILDAAFGIVLERGYAGASTLEIATRAKVSKRELYALFGSKRGLLAAGIKERTDRMSIPLEFPDITSRAALSRALTSYAIALLAGLTDPPVLALYRLAIGEAARAPELAATLNTEGHDASGRAFAEFLHKAQARGLLDNAETPEELGGQFVSLALRDMLVRQLLLAAERPAPGEIEYRAQKATDLFLRLHGRGL